MKLKLLLSISLAILVVFGLPYKTLAQNKAKSSSKISDIELVPKGKPLSFYLTKGGRLLETGDYLGAIAYLEAALNAPRKKVKPSIIALAETLYKTALIYKEAKSLKEQGKAEEAVAKYIEINKINPVDPKPLEFILETFDLLSEAAEKRSDYEEAYKLYEQWLRFAPQNDFPRQQMLKNLKLAAETAQKKGDTNKTLELYQKLSRIEPENREIEKIIAQIEKEQTISEAESSLKKDDLSIAMAKLNGALSLYPSEPRLIDALRLAQGQQEFNKAESLMKSYKYNEALRVYKNVLQFLPEKKAYVDMRSQEIFLRLGSDYKSNGSVQLNGTITGSVTVQIIDNKLVILSGNNNISAKLQGKFPARLFDAKLVRLSGDLQAKIISYPNINNRYSLTLELTPKKENVFSLNLDWDLSNTGLVTWQGQVTKSTLIRLQTLFVDQTENCQNVVVSFDPLPHEAYELSLTKLQGSEQVITRIIQKPSLSNNYATVVEVITNNSKAENIVLKMQWILLRVPEKKK